VQGGSAGLVGGGSDGAKKGTGDAKATDGKKDAAKKDDAASGDDSKKKGGFGLSKLASFGGGEKKQAQVVGSGAGRGFDPEVDAKGGSNPAAVTVKVTPEDVDAFKKEGKLT
jgi:hypothetical protein